MDGPHTLTLPPRSASNPLDSKHLRSVISTALAATPIDEEALRRHPATGVESMTGTATSDFRSFVRAPLATPAQLADEPAAFPSTSDATPRETLFQDWRARLTRNLSRRSEGRWEPLTYVHEESAARGH
jgi:hypothetical protein